MLVIRCFHPINSFIASYNLPVCQFNLFVQEYYRHNRLFVLCHHHSFKFDDVKVKLMTF